MARRLARKIARRVPRSFGRDELESAAMLGLTEAALRYDSTRGEPFVAYAAKRIRGAVLDELRRRDALTRRRRAEARKLSEVTRELEARHGRKATVEELGAELGMSTEEVHDAQTRLQAPTLVPLDDVRDAPSAQVSRPIDEQVELRRRSTALRSALDKLGKRELMVLSMYYQEGLTQKEIGAVFGVSESRICQLRTRALRTLRGAMQELA